LNSTLGFQFFILVRFEFHLKFLIFVCLGFMRKTCISVWQKSKWMKKEVYAVLWEEHFLMFDKGWSEREKKSLWFCEKNVSMCLTKFKMSKERSLCGFVRRTTPSVWQRLKWTRIEVCAVLWSKHFLVCDRRWSKQEGFKSVQVLEA